MIAAHPFVDQWRSRAANLAAWGATDAARIWEIAARELEEYELEHALESLTVTQAAAESGYSVEHIGRLVAEGRIENAGKKGSPRIRRCDLPKKPQKSAHTDPDLVGRTLGRSKGR